MKIRSSLLALLLCTLALCALTPAANAQTGSGFMPVPAQSLNLGTFGTGTLTAVKITSISLQNGQFIASGLATVNTATGTAIGSFTNAVLAASTIAVSGNVCPILHLDIGPISLNILGLVVTVPNHIILDITAVRGPGNLLGNLLCDIVHLLDQNPTPTPFLSTLLNQVLALLN